MLPTTYNAIRTHGLEPDTGTVHNFWWLVPNTYFATHPEYFPLINGVRTAVGDDLIGPQLCISNPNVYNIIVQKAVQSLYSYPDMKVFGIVPNDGSGGWCLCDNCKAWDGDQADTGVYSNRLIKLCNSVADYLAPYFPGVKIGTLAYSEYVNPPTIPVSDNVIVYYCTGGRNYMSKLTDSNDPDNSAIMARINGWMAMANNVALYEYYYFTGMNYCPMPYSRTLCQEFPELKALGLKGISAETTSDRGWSIPSVFPYAFARATWNTSLIYDDVLSDYCHKRYGPAASIMQAYHSLYENTIYSHVPVFKMFGPAVQLFPSAFTNETIDALDGYLTSAAAAAAGANSYYINAIEADRSTFEKFRSLRKDPATIPGIGSNLVLNPGVESGASDWLTNIQSGNYQFSISNESPHSGNYSLKITCTGATGRARWYQNNSPVLAGRKYAASFWIRATGGARGEIWLYQSNTNLGQIAFQDSNNQWVQLVCPEIVATNDNSIRIHLNSEGPGVVYFDDCFLAELPN